MFLNREVVLRDYAEHLEKVRKADELRRAEQRTVSSVALRAALKHHLAIDVPPEAVSFDDECAYWVWENCRFWRQDYSNTPCVLYAAPHYPNEMWDADHEWVGAFPQISRAIYSRVDLGELITRMDEQGDNLFKTRKSSALASDIAPVADLGVLTLVEQARRCAGAVSLYEDPVAESLMHAILALADAVEALER